MPALLFSYGSNSPPNLARILGQGPQSLERRSCHARVHGVSLVFAGFSPRWMGGVGTLEYAGGSSVPGTLTLMKDGWWDALDEREECPVFYRREEVEAHVLEGTANHIPVAPARVEGRFLVFKAVAYVLKDDSVTTPPSDRFRASINAHRRHWHLDEDL